jgi:putative transposase
MANRYGESMSDYRRWRAEGGTFFFTAVTHQRQRFLTSPLGRNALRDAFRQVRRLRPFQVVAIVLLPDHLHTVWELPRGATDYTTRWRQIKTLVTRALAGRIGGAAISASRQRRVEKGIWQRRFYEHMCRDEADVKRLVHYIHVNPVNHRLSAQVRNWPWSSFHCCVHLGEYSIDWGGSDIWYGDEFHRLE